MTGKMKHMLNVLVLGLGIICPSIARADDQQLVVDYLDSIGAESEYYRIYPIAEDYVGRTFPNASFFAVQFVQYPYFVYPPDPLEKQSNVFIVLRGNVSFIDDTDGLLSFFADQLRPVPDSDSAKDAGRAWLRLSEEFKQDLFFTFSDPAVNYTPMPSGALVTGQVLVLNGGTGSIDMKMTLDEVGSVVDVHESNSVVPGVRPICQATKLLDRDPIVRRMAEQDILVMGRAAKSYLDMQRAKARPALKRAIDRIWARIVSEGR
jgi:hypothetical protein